MQASKRSCLAVGIMMVALLAAPAAAQSQCGSNCNTAGLQCKFPPAKYTGSGGFQGSMFKYSCLGDAGQDCKHKSNSVDPKDKAKSCCSCFLYAAHASKETPGTIFVDRDLKTNKHVLVMPADACTGVENWNKGGCPGEKIWSKGAQELERANHKYDYGMAINPVERRGMHQMHVHLAKVKNDPSVKLLDAISDVHSKVKKTTWHIDCGGGSTLRNCKPLGQNDPVDPAKHLKVNIFTGISDPAGARPFGTVYGNNPNSASNDNVLRSSTLVVHVPNTVQTWAVVTNPTGPGESMLEV